MKIPKTNMNKNTLYFIIALFVFNNIIGQMNSFTLDCSLKKNYSGYIFLEYENKLDSCLIVNNHFSFKGSLNNEVSFASFSLKGKKSNTPGLYLENKKMELKLDIEDSKNKGYVIFTILSVEGSKTALIMEDYDNFINKNKSENNFNQILLDKLDTIVTQNPKNPLRNIYSKLDKKIQSKFYLTKIGQNLYPENYIKINDFAYEINLPDIKNQLFSTKSLINKWYLIDFWASWCSPCKKQFPELKRIYNLNKNKNFEIIGVSIDNNRQKWIETLNNENFDWINVIEVDGLYGVAVQKYNFNSIPTNFLVNPEGKVVFKNISLKELEIFLNTL